LYVYNPPETILGATIVSFTGGFPLITYRTGMFPTVVALSKFFGTGTVVYA